MKRMLAVLGVVALGATTAHAAEDCSLHNPGACRDINELVWSKTKPRLPAVVAAFLQGAPKLYLGTSSFSAGSYASGAVVGPGDHHDRLPDGGWFFDGFTPHDATDRGAVILNGDGTIRIVALLVTAADASAPNPELNRYRLRLYSHGEPDTENVHLLQNWAGYTIKTENQTDPQNPGNLTGTQFLILQNGEWQRRNLP